MDKFVQITQEAKYDNFFFFFKKKILFFNTI